MARYKMDVFCSIFASIRTRLITTVTSLPGKARMRHTVDGYGQRRHGYSSRCKTWARSLHHGMRQFLFGLGDAASCASDSWPHGCLASSRRAQRVTSSRLMGKQGFEGFVGRPDSPGFGYVRQPEQALTACHQHVTYRPAPGRDSQCLKLLAFGPQAGWQVSSRCSTWQAGQVILRIVIAIPLPPYACAHVILWRANCRGYY